MVVVTTKFGNWTTYRGTIAEVSGALNLAHAQIDRSWVFSDSSGIVGVVYGG